MYLKSIYFWAIQTAQPFLLYNTIHLFFYLKQITDFYFYFSDWIAHLERNKLMFRHPESMNRCFDLWNKKADELQGWRLIAVVGICVHVCSWGHWACHWVHFRRWTQESRDLGIIKALQWKRILIMSGRWLSCGDLRSWTHWSWISFLFFMFVVHLIKTVKRCMS